MNERKIDYKQFEGERIISVSDLFEEILRKIWLIIILAVVFAVIFAGYKYMSDKSKAEASTETASYEKTVASLSDEEMREVNNIVKMYGEAAEIEQYLSESTLMEINPYHADCVAMQYILETENGNVAPIMQLLVNYVSGTPLATDLQEFYPDEDSSYLSELVTFESSFNSDLTGEEEDLIPQSNVFLVQVSHADAESCQQLADNVQQCLDNYLKSISGYFGSCSCKLLKEYASQIYDSTLESLQQSAINNQMTIQNRITTQTEALNDMQLDVLETILAGEDDADASESTVTATTNSGTNVHISRRYTIFGLLVGIVVGVILISLYYIFRKTLNIEQELRIGFGIPVFGQLHLTKQKNPLVKAWRRLTLKKKKLTLETEKRIAFTNLWNYCKSHKVDCILLASSQQGLSEATWLKEIQDELKNNQIDAEIIGGLPDSPEALEILSTYVCVVLVEELHKSLYADIVEEIEACEEQNIQIAGAIVLN